MTCEVQTLRNEAACLCGTDEATLLAMAVIAACNINTGVPMTCDLPELRAQARCLACSVPDKRELLAMLVELLCALTVTGGSGGAATEGENFCFTGLAPNQVLKIKNLDTNMANRIDMRGADEEQTMQYDDSSAC